MSFSYFNKLNYTLANEDALMEVKILPEGVKHVMAVCGSGGRVLPLLAKAPRELSFVDLSQEQLWLAEMRIAALKEFSHKEYLGFFGYPPAPMSAVQRQQAFARLTLGKPAAAFFLKFFEELNWQPIIYTGKWERTFQKLAKIAGFVTGEAGRGLFDCKTTKEQEVYLKTRFPHKRWALIVALLGNANVFNALLYKGHFPEKNVPGSYRSYYGKAYERLFLLSPARENFFLQLLFLGKIEYPEGNPTECDSEIFATAKKNLEKCRIRFVKGSILDEACAVQTPIEYLSLSDVPSYFSGKSEQEFMQRVKPALAENALVVLRSYLHVPRDLLLDGFENVTGKYQSFIAAEKTQMYVVDVYRKLAAQL